MGQNRYVGNSCSRQLLTAPFENFRRQEAEKIRKQRGRLLKKVDQPYEYINHMINCCLDPAESTAGPQFQTMLAQLTDKDVKKLKTKLSNGMKKHKGNQHREALYRSWRESLKAQRPDAASTIMENLM